MSRVSVCWRCQVFLLVLGLGACSDTGGIGGSGNEPDTIGGDPVGLLDGQIVAADASDAGPADDDATGEDPVPCSAEAECAEVWPDLEPCERAECVAGFCERTITDDPVLCDDGNHCTVDLCDIKGQCQHEVLDAPGCCEAAAQCDDGNVCTADLCEDAQCTYLAESAAVICDDANPCTEGDVCGNGLCAGSESGACQLACSLEGNAGETVSCTLGLARLGDASPAAVATAFGLDWDTGVATLTQIHAPWCKAGGAVCGTSSIPDETTALQSTGHTVFLEPADPSAWDGQVGFEVVHLTSPGAAINTAWIDGDTPSGGPSDLFVFTFELVATALDEPVLLTGLTAEAAGGTALATGVVDGLIVTSDDACGTNVCWDGNPCTEDTCGGATCTYAASEGESCDDGNPCTADDACNADGICAPAGFVPADTPCAGADLCTVAGTCDGAGACTLDPSLEVECDAPESPCLTVSCDPATGKCVSAPAPGLACDDGDACTTDDVCGEDGTCGGATVSCDDGIGCTLDGCNPAAGCTYTADDALCDDGNACTDGTCDAAAGCAQAANSASCDDGDSCTLGDACGGGVCSGNLDPSCGCVETADCAPLEDGNPCTGTFACVGGSCTIDASTIPKCPGDGFECKTDWACNPASGVCEGAASLACDDDDACTADTCSTSKGCEHALIPGCASGFVCELSGSAGTIIECPLRVARGAATDPAPSGGDVKLSWDDAAAALVDLTDEFCVGQACFPFDLIVCEDDGTGCSMQKVEPSGHDLVLVPDQKAAWTSWVTLLLFHGSAPGKPITHAIVSGTASTGGDPEVLMLHFELLTDVPAGDPVQVNVSDYHFNPSTGLDLDVSIDVIDGLRTFVATQP